MHTETLATGRAAKARVEELSLERYALVRTYKGEKSLAPAERWNAPDGVTAIRRSTIRPDDPTRVDDPSGAG